jgi:hypothetical protein
MSDSEDYDEPVLEEEEEDPEGGGEEDEEAAREETHPDRRVRIPQEDVATLYEGVKSDLAPQAQALVDEAVATANPKCGRCGADIVSYHFGCDRHHLACQACWNTHDLLEVQVPERRAGRGQQPTLKWQCAVNGCVGCIPEHNRNDQRGKPKWSTKPDDQTTVRLKEDKARVKRLMAAYIAQVYKARQEKTEAERRATQRGLHVGGRGGGGGGGTARKKDPTRHGCLRKAAQQAGCTYAELEAERKSHSSDTPAAVKRALADALAEWEEICPRKKAQRRAQERAVEQKETEDKIAQAEGLAAKNQELIAENQQLTTQLQAAEAKVTRLEQRVAQLRMLWKDAQRRQEIAEANLASIQNGDGSSSGPAPGELQEAQQAVAAATVEVQKLREQLARQVAKRDEAEDGLKQSQAQLATTQQDLQAIMQSQTELEANLVAERQQRNEAQRSLHATLIELGRRGGAEMQAALMPAANPSLAPEEPEGAGSPMGHADAVSAADEDKHDEEAAAAAEEPAPEGMAQ